MSKPLVGLIFSVSAARIRETSIPALRCTTVIKDLHA